MMARRSLARVLVLGAALITTACGGGDSEGDGNGNPTGPGGGSGTLLVSGTPVANISGAAGSEKLYRINVPAGTGFLNVTTSGGTGDVDLYVKQGSAPTTTVSDCDSESASTSESCSIASPAAGTWYIMMYGYEAYSGVTLVAAAEAGSSNVGRIFYRVRQDLSHPANSNAAWCNQPSSDYTDNNPAVPDVPSATMTTFAGPSQPGTFTASSKFGTQTITFNYTLARPADGYDRFYTKLIREYNATLNRCVDRSPEAASLTYYDQLR